MRNIFAFPWLTPVLSVVVVAILVFSTFALLKISSGGKQDLGQELLTGSIQKSPLLVSRHQTTRWHPSSRRRHSSLPYGGCKSARWFGRPFRCHVRGRNGTCRRIAAIHSVNPQVCCIGGEVILILPTSSLPSPAHNRSINLMIGPASASYAVHPTKGST